MEWNITTMLAIWGACLATLTFIWNLSKWLRDRPRLAVSIEHHEGPWGDIVSMKIRNRGEKPTTIEEVMLVAYHNPLFRLLSFPRYVENTSVAYRDSIKLPAKINYGEIWEGQAAIGEEQLVLPTRENDKLELIRQGRLYFKVRCAHTDRLISGKVKPEPSSLFG